MLGSPASEVVAKHRRLLCSVCCMTQIRHSDTVGISSVTKPSHGVAAKLPRGLHFVLCAGQLLQFPTVLVCIFIVVECRSSSWRSHGQVAYMAQQTTRARTNPTPWHFTHRRPSTCLGVRSFWMIEYRGSEPSLASGVSCMAFISAIGGRLRNSIVFLFGDLLSLLDWEFSFDTCFSFFRCIRIS